MSDVHENISSLIPAYAIGAVPEEEIASIRRHILTGEQCSVMPRASLGVLRRSRNSWSPSDLGEAPEDRDYQLWLMKDGVPTPADTFDVSGSVVIVESSHDIGGFDGAAVTVEPEGGSMAPTTPYSLTRSAAESSARSSHLSYRNVRRAHVEW